MLTIWPIIKMKNNQVISNILWLIFDKLCLLLSNLFLIAVVADYYGAEDYGLFQYATSLIMILEVIVQLIDGRVVKKKYTKQISDEIVVMSVTISKVGLSFFSSVIGIIILVSANKSLEFNLIFVSLLIDCVIKNLRFGMENRFEFLLQSRKSVIAIDSSLLLGCALQYVTVRLNKPITHIAYIQIIESALALVIIWIEYKIELKDTQHCCFSIKLSMDILKESLPLGIAVMAVIIYSKCDSVMIGVLLSEKEVGIYSVSTKIISAMLIPLIPVQTSVFPKMLELCLYKQKYESLYIRITSISTWFSFFIIVCSIVLLPIVFKLLNPDFSLGLYVCYLLLPEIVICFNSILRANHLVIHGCERFLLVTQLTTVVLNVFMNYFFIKSYGMFGAAIATVIAQFLSLFVSNFFNKTAREIVFKQVRALSPKYILMGCKYD